MDDLVKRLRAVDHMSVEDCFLQSPLYGHAADAIEALQARVAELDTTISNLRKVNEQYLKNSNENFHAANTARRDAFEEAAKVCDDEADKCDDAVKWGGHPKYIANCKAAAYAMRDRAAAIRDLAEKG